MADAWSPDEVELIVADYFAMLRAEQSGQRVNKKEHNRLLQKQLRGRSGGSIEFKHANITAALLNLGDLPTIDGYKPRFNYQQLLEKVILEYLDEERNLLEEISRGPVVHAERAPSPGVINFDEMEDTPPETILDSGIHAVRTPLSTARVARKVDFVRIDADNRDLGRKGEELILEFEQRRLHDKERRPDLAKKIVWVADLEGDGAGYDIRSFNRDDGPRLIEVKTTGQAKYHPFYVSPNELAVSEREAKHYHLYRVFKYGRAPRLYLLQGALSAICHLRPAQYEARVARP